MRGFVLGIIEGFYGRPWSWPQRESMLEFASRQILAWARSNFHWVMGDLMDQFARRWLLEAAR